MHSITLYPYLRKPTSVNCINTVARLFFVGITHCNIQDNGLSLNIAALKLIDLTPTWLLPYDIWDQKIC
jgi:hypothetical protein